MEGSYRRISDNKNKIIIKEERKPSQGMKPGAWPPSSRFSSLVMGLGSSAEISSADIELVCCDPGFVCESVCTSSLCVTATKMPNGNQGQRLIWAHGFGAFYSLVA